MKYKKVWGAGVLSLVLIATVAFGVSRVFAAGSASGLTLAVLSDDTSTAASDNSTTNGNVPVNGGQVTYRWGWTSVDDSSVSFSQTLPAGMEWDSASVVGGCSRTGSYTTPGNPEKLTCTINNLPDAPGTTDKIAILHSVANNTTLTSKLESGSNQSSNASLTAVAVSQVSLLTGVGVTASFLDAMDPETQSVPGLQIPYSFALYVPGLSGSPAENIKGQEGLTSNYSFTVTLPAGAQYVGCGTATDFRFNSGGPTFGTGASTSTNRVANPGTLSCSKSGNTLTVTATGVDGSLNRVPTTGLPTRGYYAVGGFKIWMPTSTFNTSTTVQVPAQFNNFSVQRASGGTTNVTGSNVNYGVRLAAFALNSTAASSATSVFLGANYSQNTSLTVPTSSGQSATNASICQAWDPNLQRIRSDTPLSVSGTNISPSPTTSHVTIEYGTHTYSNESQRQNASCGAVGDHAAGWYSTVTAAGGSSEVSAVRIRYNRSLNPGETLNLNVNMTAPTSASITPNLNDPSTITYLPFYNQRWSDQTSLTKLSSGYSARVPISTGSVRISTNIQQTDIKPGATANVTLQPAVTSGNDSVITDGRPAVNTTVTTTLPNGCYAFVPGTPAPVSVSPANPAAPGVGQTCADMSGQVITWSLGNAPTTPATTETPINFALNVDPGAPTPVVMTLTARIISTSDRGSDSTRSGSDTVNVSTVNQFQVSKNSSSASINSGTPFTYRVGWKNASSSDLAGAAWVVDLLPYNSDSRGTSSLGGLSVNGVTTSPSGLDIEYTTDSSEMVKTALTGDATGETDIVWTDSRPMSGVTAVRARTQSLVANASGYMDISVTPQNFALGGRIVNDVIAKADDITSPFFGVEEIEQVSSSSTISGSVFKDANYSGSKNTGDIDLEDITVTLSGHSFGTDGINNDGSGDDIDVSETTTTASDGSYSFTVSPGVYTLNTPDPLGDDELIITPAADFEVSGAVTVGGKNFGYQEPINPPVAEDDSITIYQGESVDLPVTDNDTLYVPDGVPETTIGGLTTPDRGTATLNPNKSITYVANSVWPGSVSGLTYDATFNYTLTNPQGSSTATVTVTVKRLPFATSDIIDAKDGETLDISALANDFGDTIVFDTSSPPTTDGNGAVSIIDNKLHFVPGSHTWSGSSTSYTETVTYTIKDAANKTNSGQLVMTYYRAPVVANDSRTTAYNTPITIASLGNDLVGKTPATVTIVSQPGSGSATMSGNSIVFTPTSTQTGTTSLTYRVTDALGQQNTGAVSITVADNFIATDDGSAGSPIRVPQAGKLIDVLDNDAGSSLSLTDITVPTHGTATISNGEIQYTPTGGYHGDDSFTYTIKDVLNGTKTATVYLKVIARPVLVNDTAYTDSDTTIDVSVLANDTYGPDSTVSIVSGPTSGSASVQANKIRYTPGAGGGTSTTITYRVTDDVGQGETATLSITTTDVLRAVNDGSSGVPNRVPQAGKLFDVLANDSGTDITLTSVGTPGHGVATISSGKVQYTPTGSYSGDDSFTYTITDSADVEQTATVYVIVVEAPNANNDTAATDSDTAIDIDVFANDTYDQSSVLSIVTPPGRGTATVAGNKIHYIPPANNDTSTTITYRLLDNLGQSDTATVTITVTANFMARNDGSSGAPIIIPQAGKLIDVLGNDSGLGLSITSVEQPSHGLATIESGAIRYMPSVGYKGPDNFSYTITDSRNDTRSAIVRVSVTPPAETVTPAPQKNNPEDGSTSKPSDTTPLVAGVVKEPQTVEENSPAPKPKSAGTKILLNKYEEYSQTEGKKLTLESQQVIYFDVVKPEKTENHSVTIAKVGDDYVDVVIRSDPIYDRLKVGQTKKYDVNKDGHEDIEASLISVEDGMANMTFKQLAQIVPSEKAESVEGQFNWWWLLLIIPAIALYLWHRQRKNTDRSQNSL